MATLIGGVLIGFPRVRQKYTYLSENDGFSS